MDSIATDDLLVSRCLQGDRKAHLQVYNAYSKAMFNICFRMMGAREEAEDALQNAFIDVFRRMESFRGESTLGAWIKRIVINSCLDLLKRKKLQLVEAGPELQMVEDEINVNDFEMEDLDRIKHAIRSLPTGYKVVFNLYLMEGYDHKEISEILGITEGASKSQYSRAKKKLYQILTNKVEN